MQVMISGTDEGGIEISSQIIERAERFLPMRSRFMIGLSVAPLEGGVGHDGTLGPGHGLIVTGTTPNSAAAAAGLEVGDIVHAADSIPLYRAEDLVRAVEQAGALERPVRLEGIRRSGEGMTLELKPQPRPDDRRFEAIIEGFPAGPNLPPGANRIFGGVPKAGGGFGGPGNALPGMPMPHDGWPAPGNVNPEGFGFRPDGPAPRGFVVPRDPPGPAWVAGLGELKQQLEQLRRELAELRSGEAVPGDAARDGETREQRAQRWAEERQRRQWVESEERQQEKLNRVQQELREQQRELDRQREELEHQRRQLERERDALEQAKKAVEQERRQLGEKLERARSATTHSQSPEEMARVKKELVELRRMVEELRDK
jgi:hypothetical protein